MLLSASSVIWRAAGTLYSSDVEISLICEKASFAALLSARMENTKHIFARHPANRQMLRMFESNDAEPDVSELISIDAAAEIPKHTEVNACKSGVTDFSALVGSDFSVTTWPDVGNLSIKLPFHKFV